jgi:hypothetical protein
MQITEHDLNQLEMDLALAVMRAVHEWADRVRAAEVAKSRALREFSASAEAICAAFGYPIGDMPPEFLADVTVAMTEQREPIDFSKDGMLLALWRFWGAGRGMAARRQGGRQP